MVKSLISWHTYLLTCQLVNPLTKNSANGYDLINKKAYFILLTNKINVILFAKS